MTAPAMRAEGREAHFSRVMLSPVAAFRSAAFRQCLYSLKAGELGRAEKLCAEVLASNPGEAQLWHLLAIVVANQGRYDEAVPLFSKALELAPESAPILADRGLALVRLGHLEQSLLDYNRAVALRPHEAPLWNARGLVLAGLRRPEEGLECFRQALLLQPGHADAAGNCGDMLCRLGRPGEAIESYDQALALDPGHRRAINGRGSALAALGRQREALDQRDRAIALSPEDAEAHYGRGLSLFALGQPAAALACFARALILQPGYAEAHIDNGRVLLSLGRRDEALSSYERALRIDPTLHAALAGRGIALLELDHLEEALDNFNRALAVEPESTEAIIGKARVLCRLGRYTEALNCCNRALTSVPGSIDAQGLRADAMKGLRQSNSAAELLFFRGETLRLLERLPEAIAAYDEALALRPDYPEAWLNRGRAFDYMNEPLDALHSYDRAVACRPDWAEAHTNRSIVLRSLGRSEEAVEATDRALALDPASPWAHNSRGNALSSLGRIDEALASFDRAIAASGDFAEPRFNRAVCLLASGEFERGWAEYESRWRIGVMARASHPLLKGPAWLGEQDLTDRTILLHAEQGYGDTIQFCRYAKLVAARGATVVLGAPPLMIPLLASLEGPAEIVHRAEALQEFDFHCPLLSLPLAFRTTLETVPNEVPYLTAPAEYRRVWQAKLGPKNGPRIGFAWSGNAAHRDDRNRSLTLEQVEPILSLGLPLYCVQRQLRAVDMPLFATYPNLAYFGQDLRDFADTAALIEEMDLVISTDTATAHLAGALGKPVWLMLTYAADFRWLLYREDSPWYPTMRLFRQSRPGDWHTVVERVREGLTAFCSDPVLIR